MTINGSDATSFYIKTVSGDIFCQILSSKIFDVRTDSGSVNVPESDFSSGIFNSETNSGDIRVEVLS